MIRNIQAIGNIADNRNKKEMNHVSVFDLERIEKAVTPCFTRARTVFPIGPQDHLHYTRRNTRWFSPRFLQKQTSDAMMSYEHDTQVLRQMAESLSPDDRKLCEDILHRSPLECFNFTLNKFRDAFLKSPWEIPDITFTGLLRLHLILKERSLEFPESDMSTAGYHISQVIKDEWRSCANYSMVDRPRDRSSIRGALVDIQNDYKLFMSLEKEHCDATLPEKAPFGEFSYYCLSSA